MNKARTDGDIMKIARKIDELQQQIKDCLDQIEESDHPNKDAIIASMDDNIIYSHSWARHIVMGHLIKPGQWDYDTYTYQREDGAICHRKDEPFHIAARAAHQTRRGRK